MTKEAALQNFFGSFGIPAYPSSAVPEDAVFPWLTYDLVTGAWGDDSVSITVNLWYYVTDESLPNAKAREVSAAIGLGGRMISCDGGAIWLRRGVPWCQSLTDASDSKIKRRYINMTAEYLTID
ncbi:MAG: hypothetical protein LUC17_00015 [Oscillospiraceae bacterium]|nr:hypothetical protein [Oscillospiraceae bacterium]